MPFSGTRGCRITNDLIKIQDAKAKELKTKSQVNISCHLSLLSLITVVLIIISQHQEEWLEESSMEGMKSRSGCCRWSGTKEKAEHKAEDKREEVGGLKKDWLLGVYILLILS